MCVNWLSLLANESDLKMIDDKEKCGRVNQLKASFVKIERYFFRNPGALFIIVFDVLIVSCAFLLIQENPLVDDVAVFAYCFLVVGVVLQAVAFLRIKDQGCEC